MSKFFNETTNAQHTEAAAAAPANRDIQQLVGALKQSLEDGSGAPAHSAETGLKDLLKPLQDSRGVAFQLAERRLENCRAIRLPRTEAKSLLATQHNPAWHAAVEAYRTIRTRLVKQQTASGTRSLVVSSASQGEGKTLAAFNLAVCYSQIEDWPVLLVDADLRTRGLTRLLGEAESRGLAGILGGDCGFPTEVLRTDIPDLYFLPAGKASRSPTELFSRDNWKEFMGWASETFRLVIVDSPPALTVSDFELIMAHCESVMMIVQARKTARESLTQVLAQVDPSKMAGVVFNGAEETSNPADHRSWGAVQPTA
ncbi:MAG TPA: CpsD/CapB family tyrosine-protein kinase [Candidatus Angelobacter sp.]